MEVKAAVKTLQEELAAAREELKTLKAENKSLLTTLEKRREILSRRGEGISVVWVLR